MRPTSKWKNKKTKKISWGFRCAAVVNVKSQSEKYWCLAGLRSRSLQWRELKHLQLTEGAMINLSSRGRCLRYQSGLAVECAHAAQRLHFTNTPPQSGFRQTRRGGGVKGQMIQRSSRSIVTWRVFALYAATLRCVCLCGRRRWQLLKESLRAAIICSAGKKDCRPFQFASSMPARTRRLPRC